ncbi:uncharacterized protein LOC121257638 [Juglans microcarpa x Juglans regia]|uniref:uncharacterized protein LOC121257638 n=1 Tax=Juglans microcarpa x Juglans regia TaxID=2249226 RepID=UPI001B7E3135|nr:uncharacterized protein LOC121257638 [Juglans microcarpa x Juglans regia]
MVPKNFLTLKAHFDLATQRFINDSAFGNTIRVMGSVWFFVCSYVLSVFGLLLRFIFRSQANDSENFQQDDQNGSSDSHIDGFREEETGFGLQISKSGDKSNGERESSNSVCASKYVFMFGKGVSGFLEEPKTMSFGVQELYEASNEYNACTEKDFQKLNSEEEAVYGEKAENPVEIFSSGKTAEKEEEETFTEKSVSGRGERDCTERNVLKDDSGDEVESVCDDCSIRFGSEPESISSSGLSMSSPMIEYEVLGDKNVGDGLETEALLANDGVKVKGVQEISTCDNIDEVSGSETRFSGTEEIGAIDSSQGSDEEYIELEPHLQNLIGLEERSLFGVESGKVENKNEEEGLVQEESEPENILEKSEGTNFREEPSESSSDYQNDSGFLWEEDEDVLEQIKMELRNQRTGGLHTILEEEEEEEEEEAESATKVEGLKPLKIDEKIEFKDRMEEIQKVYKSYSDKIRKLDMLNSQTMHAIGFLQLKEPVKSISMQKCGASAAKSLPYNIWPRKARRVTADPMHKVNEELQSDLELVYVGQVCLSWEILHWQYGKAQELQEYDSQGLHRYNQVAGDFQLFQVLLQRFIENEPFQGPRVHNYVSNRCVLRNLLQVPVIRDDCVKHRRVTREEEDHAISSGMIAEIIEESRRMFWQFLRADKDAGNMIPNGPQKNHVTLENDADLAFLMHIRADLQKKERKLKDIQKSGNCIVKRFQKHHNEKLDHSLLFAQVELRLVSRVLNMSRLTRNHLVWCREKLDQINIVSRKIHVEPSFLLFPC